MKESKKDLVKKLREAFYKVKHARTVEDYYYWQDRVEYTAHALKRIEFARAH